MLNPNRSILRLCLIFAIALLAFAIIAPDLVAQQNPQPDAVQPNAGNPNAEQPPATDDAPDTLLELLLAGGVMMIPILICSLVAVTVAIERFIALKRANVIPPTFVSDLRDELRSADYDPEAGIRYCERNPAAISKIFKAGISRMSQGHEVVEKAIEDAGAREVGKMKRGLRPLAAVGNIAPLLGLLGTVYGMIEAFRATSNPEAGSDKSTMLAEGIYVALVTTAAGLTLAIPVLIIYQILAGKIDSMVDDIDEAAIEFVEYSMFSDEAQSKVDTKSPPLEISVAPNAQPNPA